MRKKIIALLLASLLVLAGCSSNTTTKKKKKIIKKIITVADDSSTQSEDQDDEEESYDTDENYISDENDISDDYEFLINVENTNDTVPINNTSTRLNPQTGGADNEAEVLRSKIVNAKDALKTSTGTTYYISRKGNDGNDGKSPDKAWYSTSAYQAARSDLKAGDTVLFERGGVYRGSFSLVSGVNYGAYGEGPKPAIYGSLMNYTGESTWRTSDDENIWICNEYINIDVGLIVFNHGVAVGVKKDTFEEVQKNFDFWYNRDTAELYVYMDRNPGKTFYDIEICSGGNLLWGGTSCRDVIIENLTVKYHGGHGIAFGNDAKNITIRNCDIGWIGGSYLGGTERYGNGIQFWNNCDNILVENNWIYQIYDAGLTHQGGGGGIVNSNIKYLSNLIEYCSYNIEYFSGTPSKDKMINILIANNILRFAGEGWGMVRTNPQAVSHICAWGGNNAFYAENFVIKNNIFDISNNFIVNSTYNQHVNVEYSQNTYYQKAGYAFAWEDGERYDCANQAELEKAVSYVDKNPKLVKFIT